MDCIFCGIVQRAIPATVVAEDERIMAFPDIHPKAPVHIVVIPKQHIESIAHLEENHSDVIAAIIYAAKRIAAEKKLEGYKLVFNVGRLGGQSVDHLHLHLLGGWAKPGDGKKGFNVG
ncbi:MAG: histidine triad nucleotide-binding protein [Candidatus Sungbacteria bacterium RIFCSPLOWO2_01_FULL_60_25]|uniref:Histidine triad nucleotide-binding protein n=1 Tax=Candidatus Sungbacteria bacterium RIFCSPLOWO2_01_FULL_60_25 TaxID=1802281 RepID=A0A1G2LD80_9BACT|nr:MAG: histidine triad nucleotide-binding protein [Candidatus Sungbacteria bacterium RIFCSPLOWO2_01_FULL_60_25]